MALTDVDQPTTRHSWPEACPHPSESCFLSVFVRKTHYHFAVHREKSKSYKPDTFWKVPVTSISDDHEEANEDNPSKLIQYLPKFALTLFFPPSEGTEIPTVGESIDYMVTSKEAPVVSVYIVPGTDAKANLKLQKLFERYPVRVTFLQSIDFYPASSLPFESMSHHNLAAVRGAMPLPALIIESGDLLTMTIVDKSGQIVGGNTALGLYSQLSLAFQNLGESVGPEFNASNLMDNLLNRKEPLDKTNPVDVVLDGVLQPLLLSMISTLKNFAEKYAGSIFIHGMNGNVLHSLMERVQLTKISADLASNSIPTVTFDDHLVHRGIANTLVRYDTSVLPGSDREKYLHLIGQRVARSFSQDVEDSIYRGVISCAIAVKDGSAWDDHLFEIIYDDGDREELDVIELYEALRLYSVIGEKLLFVSTRDAASAKKEASRVAARSLVISSSKIQQALVLQKNAQFEQPAAKAETEEKQISNGSSKRKHVGSSSVSSLVSLDIDGQVKKKQQKQRSVEKNQSQKKERLPCDQRPSDFVSRRIAKQFHVGLFFGTIVSYRSNRRTTYWKIAYDDGDSEELDYSEVMQQIHLFESSKSNSHAICISDGELGEMSTNTSGTVLHDPGQPAEANSNASETLDLVRPGEPTEVSDHDENHIEAESALVKIVGPF